MAILRAPTTLKAIPSGTTPMSTDPVSEIRALIEERAEAIRRKDADAVMSVAHDAGVTFDLLTPLQYRSAQELRGRLTTWLDSFEGDELGYELRDLVVYADRELGCAHVLNGVKGTLKQGGEVDMWFRSTMCFSRQSGAWLVVHEHSSVPIDMETQKGEFDLQPS
jgi:ketosteroid isomerase-like protein